MVCKCQSCSCQTFLVPWDKELRICSRIQSANQVKMLISFQNNKTNLIGRLIISVVFLFNPLWPPCTLLHYQRMKMLYFSEMHLMILQI